MIQSFPVPMPAWIAARYPPNQRAAVDFLRLLIDEDMLKEIAEADYARDTEEHLVALKPIWKGADLTDMDSWFPREVLELIRWSKPTFDEWKPGMVGPRGHIMRAFSCAVLLATPNFEPDKETLIQMIDSVFLLGSEAQDATARFLVWKLDSLSYEEDRPFFALGLAAIILSLEEGLSATQEQDLADWVAGEESSERAYLSGFHESYQSSSWLFGLSFSDLRNDRWEHLIEKVRGMSGGSPLGQMIAEKHRGSPTRSIRPLP